MSIRRFLARWPRLLGIARSLRRRVSGWALRGQPAQDVFTTIYEKNHWGDVSSASGSGSNLAETSELRDALPSTLLQLGVSSILDVPCGDYHWMKELDLGQIRYTGGDIVPELVEANRTNFASESVGFEHIDLRGSDLPKAELIFVRDCLVHLSHEDVWAALENICRSDIRYLMTTTFTDRAKNDDIVTGQWRALNLEAAPFCLPRPLELLAEGHPDPEWQDKALGLWEVSQLRKSLQSKSEPDRAELSPS